jgi:hypothetical protein
MKKVFLTVLLFIFVGTTNYHGAHAFFHNSPKKAENFVILVVGFSWDGIPPCDDISPQFKIKNIPTGTKYLDFQMVDDDVPDYNHGGSMIEYKGGEIIPRGAIDYTGPCPPGGAHSYTWTVTALNDKKNLILGEGKTTKEFPPN